MGQDGKIYPPIGVEEAKEHIARGEGLLVRVTGDHIEGSLEVAQLEASPPPKDREIIFYCA